MCLGVFFLLRWHMYSSEVWFDVNCLFVSFFSFSFFLGLLAGHAKNYTNPSISFFFWSSPSLNCNYFIFDFILVCLILLVFFLSNLVLILLIVFFCFQSFSWFIYFSSILSLSISFHWNLMSSLVPILLIFIFNYFFNWFVFSNFISKHLISVGFYIKFSHNSFNCYLFYTIFLLTFFFSISSIDICLVKNLTSLFFQVCL